MNLVANICLSDIPAEVIYTAPSGKKYLSVQINERREVGMRGETHYITCLPKKELRRDGVNYFIGSAKPSAFDNGQNNAGNV